MVGIIKNLFGGKKDNFYAELKEDQAIASKTEENQEKQAVPEQTEEKTANQETQPSSAPVFTPQPPMTAQNNGQPQAEELRGETFAPTYLIPKPTASRRRPGVNMSEFLELARDMNPPRNQ